MRPDMDHTGTEESQAWAFEANSIAIIPSGFPERSVSLMLPFEFLIRSRPVSQQTRRRERVREWKDFVRQEAMRYWTSSHLPAVGPLCITLVYLYDEAALDVDNILKPIQDALIGLVFFDDSIITDAISRRRQLGGTFDLSRASSVLIEGFEFGDEFVYIHISDAPPQDQLL
jgi:crossover junction endodeoxyribonuclease RusA